MFKLITILSIFIFVNGCAPIVIDFDSSKIEREKATKIKQAQNKSNPTPDYVKIIEEDDIVVEVIKLKPTKGPQNIELQDWSISAINNADVPKCVLIGWKLQDFELVSELPNDFLIKEHSTIKVGHAKQTIWSFDDVAIALPPSGYVDSILVRDAPYDDKLKKLSCETLEKDIQTP